MSAVQAMSITRGRAAPLGATVRDGGVNFAVFSAHATQMELCLYAADGVTQTACLALHGPLDEVFCGFVAGLQPGQLYGFRASGPFTPDMGHRFNRNKLLLDPHAKRIVGQYENLAEHHGYVWGDAAGSRSFEASDNGKTALKSQVLAPANPSPRAVRPHHAPQDLFLYEMHVKGFTQRLHAVPEALRGTYAGLGHPGAISHLKRLGVSTVSLLPVQQCLSEPALQANGRTNYWGYNTLGFFCADPRLATPAAQSSATGVRDEFCAMVDALHQAGIEVVLDVVYNHTPEGNEYGATLCWRGLDNASYYRLNGHDKSVCENLTGCGNTLRVDHPRVAQFVLDSLRYWVQEMGVDGFRFDLAPVLGRTDAGFESNAAFFTALRQDPLLADVHLISEPWDSGPGGYQVGKFPGRFMDWNDQFRDTMRGYWLQTGVDRAQFARRLAASSDLFSPQHKKPWASVNFLAVHDGFTLADTVSYSGKHNYANGEDNRDGRDGELCANFGVEGLSDRPDVVEKRRRVQRAMLATVMLSQGTPMLCAGDEFGNSQQGNNNAYCQDNPTGWLDWARADSSLIDWVAQLRDLRLAYPLLHWDAWFSDRANTNANTNASLRWFNRHGAAMQVHDWHNNERAGLACLLSRPGSANSELLLIFNPQSQDRLFKLPADVCGVSVLCDSSETYACESLHHAEILAPQHSLLALLCTHHITAPP